MLLMGSLVLPEPKGSPQVVCQYGPGQEEDRPLWDSTREEPDSKNAISHCCPSGTAAKKDFRPLYRIVPGSSCHSAAPASSVWPWWTVMNATGSNLASPPYKRKARAFSSMDKKKPLLKRTKLCFSSKSQPGASQPAGQEDRGLTSMRGLPDTPMATEKCPASWAMLLEDLDATMSHSVFLFIQTPGRSLDVSYVSNPAGHSFPSQATDQMSSWDVQGSGARTPPLGQCTLGSPEMPPAASLEVPGVKTPPT